MGINLRDLLIIKEISFEELKDKKIMIDSFNVIYQFLSSIRQRDGGLLKDSKGQVTSHLTGLFNRTTKLMKLGLKPGFVFDGTPPLLKQKERERRREIKIEAEKKYQEAIKKENFEDMRKFASRTSRLTKEMIEESKELVSALGLPVVQAPSEGEAQVAYIASENDVWAGVSEDYDSLLYNIPRLLKNLTISGKRKLKATYVTVKPKIIHLSENLNNLGIDKDQLILLAMLVGTDYNQGGVKGIGPKTALKLVKEYKTNYDKLFSEIKWDQQFDTNWEEIFYLFKKMPVEKNYRLEWGNINKEKLLQLLVDKHDFSEERIEKSINDLLKKEGDKSQKGLGEWT